MQKSQSSGTGGMFLRQRIEYGFVGVWLSKAAIVIASLVSHY
jgi:hypothetical protein